MFEIVVAVGGIIVFCWMLGATFVIARGIFRKIFQPAKKLSDYKNPEETAIYWTRFDAEAEAERRGLTRTELQVLQQV